MPPKRLAVVSSRVSPGVRRVTLIGKDRMAVYDDTSAPQEMLRLFDKGAELGADPVVSYRNGPINIPYLEFAEPLRLECEDFANAVLNGVAPRASGEVGLAVVRILAAAQQSLRSGGAVVSIASVQQPDVQPLAHRTRMDTRPR